MLLKQLVLAILAASALAIPHKRACGITSGQDGEDTRECGGNHWEVTALMLDLNT